MNSRHILWVEDDPDDQELITLALEGARLDACVRFVSDGQKALDHLQACAGQELPAAIVLDYKLPMMDAPEIVQKLGADPAWRSIPVVVFTSSAEAARSPSGGLEVVAKPVDAARFVQAVQTLARRWVAP